MAGFGECEDSHSDDQTRPSRDQFGRVPIFITTSTCSKVAVLRMLPEIWMRASEMSGCWPASVSREVLTLWSLRASRRIAVAGIAYPMSREPKEGKTFRWADLVQWT